jgi:ATP-dependent helicase/nuclease subunit B
MRVIAGLDVDAGVGPATPAAIDEVVASPMALLGILERALGLTARAMTSAERAVLLLPCLDASEGYWSHSFAVDAWGTAERLLRDRDALTIEGWRGEPVSPRWDALWRVSDGLPLGIGERWAAVAGAVGTIDLACLVVVDAREEWPGAIRRALARLEAHGVEVREAIPTPAHAQGDLGAARRSGFEPVGDGSLQLVRSQGATAAAEDVAVWLAEHAQIGSTIVVAPDATLDAALHRAGLPTTGASVAAHRARGGALQVLPLCLELLQTPADPQAALELLTLPASPIPRRLADRLADALRQWPAIGSDVWTEALASHDYGADPATAVRRRRRVDVLLTPEVPRDRELVPTAILRRRIEVCAAWVRARMHTAASTERDAWALALLQHDILLRLVDGLARDPIPTPLLSRLLEAATDAAMGATPFEARAGLRSVASPGAVIRPVDTIVWWGFTRDAAPPVRTLGLTRAERAQLAAASIPIPRAGDHATSAARRWRRPLTMATQRLLLVAPLSSAPGEPLHPHPLWDEIVAGMPHDARNRWAARLQTPRPGLAPQAQARRTLAQPLALPQYRPRWDVPAGSLTRRDKESPSSLGTLVGCSLRWALRYPLGISDARTSFRLAVGPRELGSLAHEVLASVLRSSPTDPREAAARAASVFQDLGPLRVAPLFGPGHDAPREEAQLTIVRAAEEVVAWLHGHGLVAERVEEDVEREFDGRAVGGRVDLLAGQPRVVVDFKWGRRKDRRDEIANGTAYQLATYAYAAASDRGEMPEYAYFIVREQVILGRRGGPFDTHATVDGPPASQTWERFAAAFRERFAEVARGQLAAPGGTDDAPDRPIVVGDRLILPPGCEYCSYDGLCGLAFVEEDA